ncbi:MAG: hypothetical protein M3R27_02775, partial [Bacteroidota bacterium]|nr:hypothetical protein [Bacteroidota bacterium]
MKDKTSTLNNRIKSYSALAGSLIAVTSANGQVVYTDVNPDTTINLNTIYALDLNNDGITDFDLEQRSGTYGGYFSYDAVGVNPKFITNAVDTAAGGSAIAASAGYSVDASGNWIDSSAIATQFPPLAAALAVKVPAAGYSFGNFIGTTGKFLCLRFDVEGDVYYGWARINVPADAKSFTLIDYAYNGTINGASVTGSLLGISESALNNLVQIYSTDKNILVKLDAKVPVEGIVSVRNIAGQEIVNHSVTSSESTISMQSA